MSEPQHQPSPISSILLSGTQWISTNAETQIPVIEGGAAMFPPRTQPSSPIQLTLPRPQTPSTPTSRQGSTLRHRFPVALSDQIVTPPSSPVSQSAQEEPSLANFSRSADAKILSSLKRLSEREHSSTGSQRALKRENDTLKKQLEDFKQRLMHSDPSLLSQPLLAQNSDMLSKLLKVPPPPQLNVASLQSLIGRNIPKPDGMNTAQHQGRLMDRLITSGAELFNHPQATITKISGSLAKGASKTKTWFEANQATIMRVAIIILVVSLAPTLLPLLGM